MSEGLPRTGRDNSEPHQTGNMATGACIKMQERKSFLMKRKALSTGEPEDISGYPRSKRFLNEELMASHLEHLKLSSGSVTNNTSSGSGIGTIPPTHQNRLSIKTVASCPHSLENRVPRKRYLAESFMAEVQEEGGDQSMDYSPPSHKRVRVCVDETRMPEGGSVAPLLLHSPKEVKTKPSVCPSRQYDSDIMRTSSLHSAGSLSDLSSIPEEAELTRQSSGSSCGSPTPPEGAGMTVSDERDLKDEGEEVSSRHPHLNPNSTLFLSPSPGSPSSPPPPPPPSPPPRHPDTDSCSVWIAPEIQTICTDSTSLLPVSIMNEIRSKKLALVPWVGLDTLLQGQASDEGCAEVSVGATPAASHRSSDVASDADQQLPNYEDSGMEL